MKPSARFLTAAAAALIIMTSGCEKSDPTAPDSSTILVDANPTNLVLDDTETGRSNIIATILDSDGAPLSGYVVRFSTNAGSLSTDSGVKTNGNGEAKITLTLRGTDPDATVTARASGAGSDTVSVTITEPGENIPPNGTIDTPVANQSIAPGGSVTFQGTGADPDNDTPLTYLWTFGTGGPASTTAQDPGAVTFPTAGTFNVTFTVTDSLGLADVSPDTRTITVSTNQPPDGTITIPVLPTADADIGTPFQFAGNGTDPDGDIPLTFQWDFGGGATNSSAQNPTVLFNNVGIFTVTFTVTDSRGLADPQPPTRVITVTP